VLVANAARRALRHGEREVVPRVSDLEALPASMMGKIEIEALEEGRDEQIAENLVKAAILTVFKERFTPDRYRPIIEAFDEGTVVHAGEDVLSSEHVALLERVPALREAVTELTGGDESAAAVAAAVEMVLEGLHLSKRLNKDAVGARATYRARA
jgi:magnesium chelatase subunit I